jgi:hypothetical protein
VKLATTRILLLGEENKTASFSYACKFAGQYYFILAFAAER